MDVPFALPNGCPHPYSIEVLDGNGGGGAFGFMNDLLGYHMVGISCKSPLLPGEFLQMAFCGFPACMVISHCLQPGTEIGIVIPDLIDLITGVVFAGGIHSDVYYTHVHAHDVVWIDDGLFRGFDDNHEIEQFILPDKIALTPDPFKWNLAVFSDGYWDSDPAMNGADAHRIHALEAQYPLIIDNGTEIPEFMKNRFIRLIGFNDLRYDPDGKLCSKTELLPDVPVDDSLQKDLVEQFLFPRNPGNEVACLVEFDEGINQDLPLLIIRQEFNLKGLKHEIDILSQYISMSQFLPPASGVGFLATEMVRNRTQYRNREFFGVHLIPENEKNVGKLTFGPNPAHCLVIYHEPTPYENIYL